MTRPLPLADELAEVFARMSALLPSAETIHTALELVTSLATEVVPGTTGAGVSLMSDNGRRVSAAATAPVVERADTLQYDLGEGPCLTAWEQRTTVLVEDLSAEHRWPHWTAAVADTGLRSSLSSPLIAGGSALGAIKIYSTEVATFGEGAARVLHMFAAQAATLVSEVRAAEQSRHVSDDLKAAVRQRDVVQLAKGILMNRERVGEDDALAMLIALSRGQRTTMHGAAEAIVRTTPRQRH